MYYSRDVFILQMLGAFWLFLRGENGYNRGVAKRRMSRKRKGLIAALVVVVFLLVNHIASLVATPLIFNRIFASENFDVSLIPGLVDYQDIAGSYPRSEFVFPSNGVQLQGYFYDNPNSQKCVVFSAGISDPADGYLSLESACYDEGYDVVSYDGYGKGKSGGNGKRGIPEAKEDLAALLSYLNTSPWLNESLYLLGHSQGAYASASVMRDKPANVKAVAAISAMNSAEETVMEFARRKVSFLADLSWPYVTTYERYLFGEDSPRTAAEGLNISAIPALIAQGDEDKTIPLGSLSLYSHKDEITDPNVVYRVFSGEQAGHSSILYSLDALRYQKEVASSLETKEKEKGAALSEEELRTFYQSVDDRRYSTVNPDLLTSIFTLFAAN